MAYMRGLELVCIGRTHAFEVRYEGGRYLDPRGTPVDGLADMTCWACGASYYTLEDSEEAIEFCPNCGRFERRVHASLSDLLQWSRTQSFDFLRFSGRKAYAVPGQDGWELRFAMDEDELRRRGERGEVHPVG